ncbi:hypothetical protein OT109_17305 [Phycisphaeraceae bacterium D3-23]
MPISGLVVTLAPPGPDAEQAIAWMHDDARFSLGEPEPVAPRRLPITLDTDDCAEDKRLWEQMQNHPGIAFVDVACVFFEEEDEETPGNMEVRQLPTPETTPHARSRPW